MRNFRPVAVGQTNLCSLHTEINLIDEYRLVRLRLVLSRPYARSLATNRSWGKQSYAFDRFMSIVPINSELSSSFGHACSNLKRACCVEWAFQNPQRSSFRKLFM